MFYLPYSILSCPLSPSVVSSRLCLFLFYLTSYILYYDPYGVFFSFWVVCIQMMINNKSINRYVAWRWMEIASILWHFPPWCVPTLDLGPYISPKSISRSGNSPPYLRSSVYRPWRAIIIALWIHARRSQLLKGQNPTLLQSALPRCCMRINKLGHHLFVLAYCWLK